MTQAPPHSGRERIVRLLAVLLALLVYMAADGAALGAVGSAPQWGMQVNQHGLITWTDPNGPADQSGLRVGDRLISEGSRTLPVAAVVRRTVLLVRRHGHVLPAVHLPPALGPTRRGQALVLVGALMLVIGGLAWAYGRARRAPSLLGAVSAAAALAILGAVWAHDGAPLAMRLGYVDGVVLLPVAWAGFFLSFPRDWLVNPRWRRLYGGLLALAAAALASYALFFASILPYVVARTLGGTTFFLGLVFGLTALVMRGRVETGRKRQQRRIVALSAAGMVVPMLLLSFLPIELLGRPLVAYDITALTWVLLPLGLAYAIARYDLMELDVVVRRLVAIALTSLILVGLTQVTVWALRIVLPGLNQVDLFLVVIAVLAGALGGRPVSRWSKTLAERLLSPELVHSRRLLANLEPVMLTGAGDLVSLAARLEDAVRAATGAAWATVLVRRRVPGAVFCAPRKGAPNIAMSLLATALARQPWGIARLDKRGPDAPGEWAALEAAVGHAPGAVVPLIMAGEAIALLCVGDRGRGETLTGPDREALSLLATHFTLAIDHARVGAELEADRADADAFSAASARLTAALDDRPSLPRHIVDVLAALRDVRGVTLLLNNGPEGTATIAAEHGEGAVLLPPPDPAAATFGSWPVPSAWIPLTVGDSVLGALCVRWSGEYIIREQDRRLLTVYANGAAMALEHARLYERARIQAERDPVTDLYNHRAFHTRLEMALERTGAAVEQEPVGLLLIDVADFKLFNDTHGHQAGDQALRRIGDVLQACCRTSDAAARLGGDEFAMLLPGADLDATRIIAERINDLAAISGLTSPEGRQLPVRLSIGLATFPADASAANALLAKADERMYAAKRAGVAMMAPVRDTESHDEDDNGGRFGILEALVAMVDNRDRYTGEHSEQVATYACALGAEIGLSHETLETLRLAGLLHDVGKIGVPDRILRKPDKLSDEEFDIVRRHVELSEALLTVVSQDQDLMDAVRNHHERWDGAGYPRRAAADAVPLLGRIMIVADAVSAMGMDRPYRKGLPWSHIAHELRRGAGAQFDPDLVAPAQRALRQYFERVAAA